MPLVRKRIKLVKAGEAGLAKENVLAEETRTVEDAVQQEGREPSGMEGLAGPWGVSVGGWERGRASTVLPLVMVPFEPVVEEEPAARRKQATKAKRLQALTAAQETIGTFLAQEDDKGQEQAVYYFSRILTEVESRYLTMEKLCLALYTAAIKLRHYLLVTTVQVVCKVNLVRYFICCTGPT